MNLEAAQILADLRIPNMVEKSSSKPKTRTRMEVAKRVFDLAANGGFPYKYLTPEKWANKWLPSKEFVLMEIDIHAAASININAAASPHRPKNPNRVEHYLNCSVESMDPIVVDVNKQKVGRSYLGYIPNVVVLDGKHRKQAQLKQGRTKVLAWVGCKALKIMPESVLKVANISVPKGVSTPTGKPIRNTIQAASIHAAVSTSVGLANTVSRQDVGEGGARPTSGMIKGKKKASKKVEGCGARSSGSIVVPADDSSDNNVPPNASDASTRVAPSDQYQWNPNKPNLQAPGTKPGYAARFGNAAIQAPGAGVGGRVKNTGASNSEFSRYMKDKDMAADSSCGCGADDCSDCNDKKIKTVKSVAPPGYSEKTMHKMKRKLGTTGAFKVAWSEHNAKKRQK